MVTQEDKKLLVGIFVDISTILEGIDKGDLIPEFQRICQVMDKKQMPKNQQIKAMVEFLRREVEILD